VNICTIIARNYLAHARTLAASFLEHHPDATCVVLVIDEINDAFDPGGEQAVIVGPGDLGFKPGEFADMAARYDVLELSTAVKPWLLRHMLEHYDDGSGIAYFDPDIQVHSRMVELEEMLAAHAVVLTPHLTEAMPRDGKRPDEPALLIAGAFNLGFIGLSRSDDAYWLLDWWGERLKRDCVVAPEVGLFVDQRWIDLVPGLLEDVAVLRLPSYNVAYWNVATRPLGRDGDGYTVSGLPLRFFHFSGYSPDAPDQLSKHQNRVRLEDDPTLRELCDAYAAALREHGYEDVRGLAYSLDRLPSGQVLDRPLRRLYADARESGALPEFCWTPEGERRFLAWLAEPSEAAPGMTRYFRAVWQERPDLQAVFPDPAGADAEDFARWMRGHGVEQYAIPPALLPPAPPAPPASVREPVAPRRDRPRPPVGVNVAGYVRAELGVGEVARQVIGALDVAGMPCHPIALTAPGSRQGHYFDADDRAEAVFDLNLLCVNADMVPSFAAEAGPAFFAGRPTVGWWWWEIEAFPEHLHGAFDHVDEVWVGSRFIADALSQVSPVPVVPMPVPVSFPTVEALAPGELGWPDAFTFLFSFDYNSVFARKNPLAVIDAYTRAFTAGEGTALVIKSINHERHPDEHALLLEAAQGREDIVLMDEYLEPRDKDRLMASCDCYVSLHRSEGFGLTIAEAMWHGKPVVATGYGGNTEFTDERTAFPVRWAHVPVGGDAGPYPPEARWAEPDVEHASTLLRHVVDVPEEAGARAARGAAELRERHAPGAAGRVMVDRLLRMSEHAPRQAPLSPVGHWVADIGADDRARLDLRTSVQGARSRLGTTGRGARKLLLRAMRPYTAHQDRVNRTLADAQQHAAVHVGEALTDLERRLRRDHAQLAGQLRRERSTIAQLTHALWREHSARERLEAAHHALRAQLYALPYLQGEPFTIFDAPAAGRVLGFTDAGEGDAAEADRYRAFEDVFRGSEEFIGSRQRRYLPIVGDRVPVVDVGCGRGEFLDVLASAGIEAVGVDSDEGMVARCREKGHAATVLGDGIAYLEGLPERSVGTVFSAQVIEHLPYEVLQRLLTASLRVLVPGGRFIAETVNPHSISALKAFWVDPTHQHPLFPETMLGLCRAAGFDAAYVFHPNGAGDVEADRHVTGEYAVVASTPRSDV
jgi:SAM-dependent methyltransferase